MLHLQLQRIYIPTYKNVQI